MHSTTDARPIPAVANAAVQVLLLGAVSLITVWMLYRAPWHTPADACVLASVACLVTVTYLWFTRRRVPAQPFERILLAIFLAAMPLLYLLRYLVHADGPGLWIELLGLAIFAALAAYVVTRIPAYRRTL